MDCVASKAWLDQMFNFVGVISNPVSSHSFSGGIDVNSLEKKKKMNSVKQSVTAGRTLLQ